MTDVKLLIDKIISGDTKAFQSLIEKYQRLVSHIVFRMISNKSDREDVCQDVFIKVYQNLSNFQFESKISTWIAKIAYNTSINHLKKKKVPLFNDCSSENKSIEDYLSNHTSPEEFAEDSDLALRLQNEINKLPVQFRTILTLYHLDEMSYAEIVEIMGLPDGTVKSYLFRARKLLKKRLITKFPLEELWH
ncbi:MAG: RNA polymerase sigma factor [bacterium]